MTIATTSGRAIPDTEVRRRLPTASRLPPGEAGEVLVRGYNVMREYFDDPVATAETIDADGWLHTGDIGVLDERGYLQITDRLKDMYVVGGFNAYPAEIEQTLDRARRGQRGRRHRRAGRADGRGRQGVRRDRGRARALEPDELIGWARERLANYKVPRHVEVVTELPRNASGKVRKGELRAQGPGAS